MAYIKERGNNNYFVRVSCGTLDNGRPFQKSRLFRPSRVNLPESKVRTGVRPLSSRNAMMRFFAPIIFAAIPTQVSLCTINVSSRSCAMGKSSFVAISDFPARKIGSCISSLIISFLLTEYSYCFRNKYGGSFIILVNILLEPLVGNVHLAKT